MNARATTSDLATLEACVRQATLAVSSHNTQPWRFRVCVRREYIDLIADRTRSLPINDPHDRELTISCGAALFNLRLAAAASGLGSTEEALPVASDPDLLARVTLLQSPVHGIADAGELERALPLRRTFRKPFLTQSIPQNMTESLREAAETQGATLAVLDSPGLRGDAVDIVEEADHRLRSDPGWRQELASWMNPQRQGEGFGIPGLALAAAGLVARSFDIGGGIAARGPQILEGSPLLLLLGSKNDTPADWLATGQALQRVLLRACADGLQASFLTQPMHYPELRQRLATLAPQVGIPQILLRLGFTTDKLASVVRRPLDQILDLDWA
ncbi:MAG: nitroreductase [Pseudomonadota bacterium]